MKKFLLMPMLIIAAMFIFFACKKDVNNDPLLTSDAKPVAKTVLDPLTLSCGNSTKNSIELNVTAGATGAGAGFSVQWMTKAELEANNNIWYASDDPRLCKASFSGNANQSRYDLLANQTTIITIGDLLMDNGASGANCGTDGLDCGTTYVFRAFAHSSGTLTKSVFSSETCSTEGCEPLADCNSKHFGWWKNNREKYPQLIEQNGMTIAGITYTADQLDLILHTPGSGNGLIILGHQLIAAKLNLLSTVYIDNAEAAIAQGATGQGPAYIIGQDNPGARWQATLSGILNKYNNCKEPE